MHVILWRRRQRSKSEGVVCVGGRGGAGANFGCMACGVQITIFSAALHRCRHHSICSITICCRETEREAEEKEEKEEEGRRGRDKKKRRRRRRRKGGGR